MHEGVWTSATYALRVFNLLTVFSFREYLTLNCFIVVFELKFAAFKIKFLTTNKIAKFKKKTN